MNNPLSFEPYPSVKKRKYAYYRIYVRNYVVYYVVIGDVMEVRRFLYGARDTERYFERIMVMVILCIDNIAIFHTI